MVQIFEGLKIIKYEAVPLVLDIIKITAPWEKDWKYAESGSLFLHGQRGAALSSLSFFSLVARCGGCYFPIKGAATMLSTIISAKNSRDSGCNVTSQEISYCAA